MFPFLAVTWSLTCSYSQMLASQNPTSCVPLPSFYNPMIAPCPSCACGCKHKKNCAYNDPNDSSVANYRACWPVGIAVTNFNYRMNYTQWTRDAQHPNLDKLANVSSFLYKPLIHYNSNDTGMFFGIKDHNDLLTEAGHVESELILRKDTKVFTLKQSWGISIENYFNGDECEMPLPDIPIPTQLC